jgi:hypothetical protein
MLVNNIFKKTFVVCQTAQLFLSNHVLNAPNKTKFVHCPLTTSSPNTIILTHRLNNFPALLIQYENDFMNLYTLFYFYFCAIFLAPYTQLVYILLHFYYLLLYIM